MRRFVNEDTVLGEIVNGQSLNRFSYVNWNPVSYVNPEGNTPIAVAAGVYGAIWNVGAQVASDVLTGQRSDWETYSAQAVGGFAGGFVMGSTGNLALASTASAVPGNATKQGLYYVFDRDKFSIAEGVTDTIIDYGANYLAGKLGDYLCGNVNNAKWANKVIKKYKTAFTGKYAEVELFQKGYVSFNVFALRNALINSHSLLNRFSDKC